MNDLAVLLYARWMVLKNCLMGGVRDFLADEQGDVNVVSIVVLIGIAVLLAVLFRDQVKDLIEDLFKTISGNATKAVS